MADFGGEIRFTVEGVGRLKLRGKVTTEPSNLKIDPITNQDNSISRSKQPKGFVAEMTFEDSADGVRATDLDWNAIMRGGPYNMTMVEESNNIIHAWTQGWFTGDPKVDRMNGEVTGVQLHAPAYRVSAA